MIGKKHNKTEFLDTLVSVYTSMKKDEKEKLNDIAIKIYADFVKPNLTNLEKEKVEKPTGETPIRQTRS